MTKNRIIPYRPHLKDLAKELRKNSTLAEIMLWESIKGKQLGFQFHRQVPIDEFIVDFYCHELMLAIEVDGSSHDHEIALGEDEKRQARLEKFGVRFLRFDDLDVQQQTERVVQSIQDFIKSLN